MGKASMGVKFRYALPTIRTSSPTSIRVRSYPIATSPEYVEAVPSSISSSYPGIGPPITCEYTASFGFILLKISPAYVGVV